MTTKTKTKSIAVWDNLSGEEKLLRALFGNHGSFSVRDRAWIPEVWNGYLNPAEAGREQQVYALLETYPHCTPEIILRVGREFELMGWKNAEDRGITNSEWLWKRSRFLAGFK